MLAGDKITVAEFNKRVLEHYKMINSIPPNKITLTTGQFSENILNVSSRQAAPFATVFVANLFDLLGG
jgi:hypothetical protein